jgi:FkbM family methyltransferase
VNLQTVIGSAKHGMVTLRRHLFERCGRGEYSRLARHGLDAKLEKYLPPKGFFVEAGAYEGLYASNTYYLERIKGWRGVLIEPIPQYAQRCVRRRPRSHVVQCALVSPAFSSKTVTMTFSHSASRVRCAEETDVAAVSPDETTKSRTCSVEVAARTLTSVLAELEVPSIDFLSLDVEGYESEVLAGLDLAVYRPLFLLVECWTPQALGRIQQQIEAHHELVAPLTDCDYLFRAL